MPKRYELYRLVKLMVVCAALALQSACGGSDWRLQIGYGGSGIASPPYLPPAGTGVTVDVAAAWRHYLEAQRYWDTSGQRSGSPFTLTLARTQGPDRLFPYNGQLLQSSGDTLRLRLAGVASDAIERTLYFNKDSLIGITEDPGGAVRCAVNRTPLPPLPGLARVGDSGILAILDRFDNCEDGAAVVGTVELRWAIRQDLAVTLFCLTTLDQRGAAVLEATHTVCLQTSAAGELGDGARLSLQRADGSDISGKNY